MDTVQKRQNVEQARIGGVGVVFKTAAYSMTINDRHVRADASGGSFTLTLPSVAEAAGMIFDIEAVDVDSTAVTVQDKGDDAGLTNITLNADNEHVVLYSNGYSWRELKTGYS